MRAAPRLDIGVAEQVFAALTKALPAAMPDPGGRASCAGRESNIDAPPCSSRVTRRIMSSGRKSPDVGLRITLQKKIVEIRGAIRRPAAVESEKVFVAIKAPCHKVIKGVFLTLPFLLEDVEVAVCSSVTRKRSSFDTGVFCVHHRTVLP